MIFYIFGRLDDEIETLNSITIDATTFVALPTSPLHAQDYANWEFDVS
ncbi:hypothetical protein NC651_004174 [Populus alba x Populus x berolinensis]|nr:hypothetical protein NC651_004174 [Populus alba x Populus x berolinensis]